MEKALGKSKFFYYIGWVSCWTAGSERKHFSSNRAQAQSNYYCAHGQLVGRVVPYGNEEYVDPMLRSQWCFRLSFDVLLLTIVVLYISEAPIATAISLSLR